jgi:hypothetical protein
MNRLRGLIDNLSFTQGVLVKRALSLLQLGAGFYLVDVIKPYIVPVMLVSLGTIGVILFQAVVETECHHQDTL